MSKQNTFTSTENAVSRTPFEIWQQIIRQTVQWDLLPSETDQVANIVLFSRSCNRYHRYMESLTTRVKLSLVCRSWHSIIGEIGDHLVITDLRKHYWPSKNHLKRACDVEVIHDERLCRCNYDGISNAGEWCGDLPEVIPISEMTRSLQTDTYPLQPQILLLNYVNDAKYYVQSNPSSVRVLLWPPILHTDLLGALDLLTNLTHLHTYIVIERIDQFKQDISLPNLQHLRLSLYRNWVSEAYLDPPAALQLGPTISRWKIPRLSTFTVMGTINQYIANELECLLSKCAETLTAFIADSLGMINDAGFQPDKHLFWDKFPNLSLFGISIKWFSPTLTVPEQFNDITCSKGPMAVFLASPERHWDDEKTVTCAKNLMRWCSAHPRGINRLVIHDPWEVYANNILRYSRGEWYAARGRHARLFFDEVLRWDISVVDSNGVDLRGDGRWFIDMWDSMCPPPSPEPIQSVIADVGNDTQNEIEQVDSDEYLETDSMEEEDVWSPGFVLPE